MRQGLTIVINEGNHDPEGTLLREVQAQQQHGSHVVHALAIAHIRLVNRESQQHMAKGGLALG